MAVVHPLAGMVHFLDTSRIAKKSILKSASSVGNTLLFFVNFLLIYLFFLSSNNKYKRLTYFAHRFKIVVFYLIFDPRGFDAAQMPKKPSL